MFRLPFDSSKALHFYCLCVGSYLILFPQNLVEEMHETNQQLPKFIQYFTSQFFENRVGIMFLGVIHLFMFFLLLKRSQKNINLLTATYVVFIVCLSFEFFTKIAFSEGQKRSEDLQRFAIHLLILSIFLQHYSQNNKEKVQDLKHENVVKNEVQKSKENVKKADEKQKNKVL